VLGNYIVYLEGKAFNVSNDHFTSLEPIKVDDLVINVIWINYIDFPDHELFSALAVIENKITRVKRAIA
jgi:hypothetical protein